jgi:hypothetical protein
MPIIDDLPDEPFVAWDWDETLSHDGERLNQSYRPLLDMVKEKGLKQVIITGRYPTAPPVPDLGIMPIISIHTINTPKYDFFNAKRFKMWVMRLPEVRKNMVCYVDTDPTTIRVLGTNGILTIPPTMLEDFLEKMGK